ncbi:MAG: DNA repair protein RecO [Peptococcaceae bacterium]|nr:DNA repair protein RecO [Peptococcaceae bacterium]
MKHYKTEAVVIRAKDSGNGDKLMILFSKDQGKIKAMAHGVAKPTSRKRGAVQLFSHSRFLISKGRELDTISQGELIEIFPFLWNNLERFAQASYLAELVDAFTPEGEPNSRIFTMLLKTLHRLADSDGELLTRVFEIRLLTLSGFRPVLEHCANCQGQITGQIVFSPGLGGILCEKCREVDSKAIQLNRGALENMKLYLTWSIEKLHRVKNDPTTGNQIKQALQSYIRYTLERKLKSTDYALLLI